MRTIYNSTCLRKHKVTEQEVDEVYATGIDFDLKFQRFLRYVLCPRELNDRNRLRGASNRGEPRQDNALSIVGLSHLEQIQKC